MDSVVFETTQDAAVAVGGDDVVFCVVILCLSVLSMIIFAASSSSAGDGEGKPRRRSGFRANGPVFVGGWGCACGGCRAGVGVCGTYLS